MKATNISSLLRQLAEKYAQVAVNVLGNNLLSIALFGSVARGEATETSDIDLFIVCRQLPRGVFKRYELLEPIREELRSDLEKLWKQGIYANFTELTFTEEEAKRLRWIYLDMVEDAVILFDRSGFLEGILNALRNRLQELGARREEVNGVRYWVLKPDWKPGEVIEL
ncbi:MAG: nucleotidyltransferase domain-containing protein [Armatimonadetes bacterium]|nr:nucleotidyltransferase domain-containing protein [Armatimonadota bacterium]